jgi:hypothetical protein
MRDAETISRETAQKVATDRFAWGIGNGVDETVEGSPGLGQLRKGAFDLLITGDIELDHQLGVEFGGKVIDPVAEALTLVAEGQLGPFAVAGLGHAIGDGTIVQQTGDQQSLAGEKTHVGSWFCNMQRWIFAWQARLAH